MSTTTNFIAELVRAANKIDRLTTVEKYRLLERAAYTIRDMEAQLGNAIDQKAHRIAGELLTLTEMVMDGGYNVLVAQGMLEGADAIRRLRILADKKLN
ncbi:hypothetical protein [Rhizobium sp. BK376]|uniref:hypothetical protein n=1 Tax=Rhizobium sp. BK376 TaxID=2512149 RepID=UPI001043C6F2|nr:hypothetical protein [Rhizobium sp. BK376]TCR63353.1 hypothetical protein EV561_1718 [Rhizobium sp. BK376]